MKPSALFQPWASRAMQWQQSTNLMLILAGLMAEAIQHPDVISAYLGEANYA